MRTRGLILASLILAACGASPEIGKPVLKVLSTGRGPKRVMRYKLEPGLRQTMVMKMRMDMGNLPSPPNMLLTMAIEIQHVAANGDITYRFSVDDVGVVDSYGVPQEVPAAFAGALDEVLSMAGTVTVTDRGETKRGALDLPKGASQQMKQMMGGFQQSIQQFSCPLPEEPVGIGAKWELHMILEQATFTLEQVATFELTEWEGDTGVMKIRLTQEAEDQEMKVPGMPRNAKLVLESLKSRGGGEIEFDLARPVPVRAALDIESEIKVSASMGSQTQHMGTTMHATVELDGR